MAPNILRWNKIPIWAVLPPKPSKNSETMRRGFRIILSLFEFLQCFGCLERGNGGWQLGAVHRGQRVGKTRGWASWSGGLCKFTRSWGFCDAKLLSHFIQAPQGTGNAKASHTTRLANQFTYSKVNNPSRSSSGSFGTKFEHFCPQPLPPIAGSVAEQSASELLIIA